jgi:hypothetical protein
MFKDDIATYVSLNWLEISKFPLDMMYPYWWTTHMQSGSTPILPFATLASVHKAVTRSR